VFKRGGENRGSSSTPRRGHEHHAITAIRDIRTMSWRQPVAVRERSARHADPQNLDASTITTPTGPVHVSAT